MSSFFFDRPSPAPFRWAGWLLRCAVFCALVAAVVWLAFEKFVDQQLVDGISAEINAKISPVGLQAEIGDANLIKGKGLRLSNLQINLGGEFQVDQKVQSRLEVYELFVHANASLAELAAQTMQAQAIELKRARLTLVKQADGRWDFEPILNLLSELSPEESNLTPVVVKDCEIELIDQANPDMPSMLVSSIDFSLHPVVHQGRELIQLTGKFRTQAVSDVSVTAYFDRERKLWKCELSAVDASLANGVARFAQGQEGAKAFSSLSGTLSFNATAQGKLPEDWQIDESLLPQFSVSGQLKQVSADDPMLPFPVRDLNAFFSITHQGIAITKATGRIGDQGNFQINYTQAGLLTREGWHLDGFVNQFHFQNHERLRRWMPDYCHKACRDYSPEGISNIEFDLTHDGQKLHRHVKGVLTDMSFSYIKLPYRLDHCTGLVEIVSDRCTFDVQSSSGQEPIRLHGFVNQFEKDSVYQVKIAVPGSLPIDQKMLDAMETQPKLARVIHAFNAKGRVGGLGRIERRVPKGKVERAYDVRLQGCSVRHNSFDYPILNLEGLVMVRDSEFQFQDLKGSNGSGVVRCNGQWNPAEGLGLRFLCDTVPLNDELKFALKPEIRRIWNGFRPRGTLDFLRVDLTMPPGSTRANVGVEATLNSSDVDANYVSIHPVWFPYQINHLTGKIRLADGKIELTDISGNHQKTWIACRGNGHYSNRSWSLRLKDLFVSSLKVDDDLLAAVPQTLAPTLKNLEYEGLMNVSGEITLAGDKQNVTQRTSVTAPAEPATKRKSRTSLAWDIAVNMSQAQMKVGLPVKNVFGTLSLVGLFDGDEVDCNGQLDIDSLTVHGTQVTGVKGPLRFENGRVFAGVFARPGKLANGNLSPLGNGRPDSLIGSLHKGTIELDAQLDSANNNEYYFQATLNDSCLATACREWAPELENVEGRSFAEIRMRGDGTGTHSNRGVGNIRLSDARIYELPLFLSLLKILKVRQPNRTAFDSGQIEFTVQGETLIFDRMEFNGDAISLIGNGQMNFDRDIELDFYSMMGRNRINIPLITNLVRASSQQVLHISVDGTLEDPQMHRQVLPQLSELRQLFQPRNVTPIQRDPLVGTVSAELPFGESYFQQTEGRDSAEIGLKIE